MSDLEKKFHARLKRWMAADQSWDRKSKREFLEAWKGPLDGWRFCTGMSWNERKDA